MAKVDYPDEKGAFDVERKEVLSFIKMDDKDKTAEVCMAAVQKYGWTLNRVPMKLLTAELCLAAVSNAPGALAFVPRKLRTRELCLKALQTPLNFEGGNQFWVRLLPAFRYVPLKFKFDDTAAGQKPSDLCHAALKQDERALAYVPIKLRTHELCLAAVRCFGAALSYVPKELKTEAPGARELCMAAVAQNGDALKYIPAPYRTPELCMAAVRENGFSLMNVPFRLRTLEICLAAVEARLNDKSTEKIRQQIKNLDDHGLFWDIPKPLIAQVKAALS